MFCLFLTRRPRGLTLALLSLCTAQLLVGLVTTHADEDDEDEDDVGLPGLAVTYRTPGDGGRMPIAKLAARPALALDAKSGIDPSLAADKFQADYAGRLFVQRPGSYSFRVELSGKFTLKIGGQTVFDGVASDGAEGSFTSPSVPLKYGQNELTATFTKLAAEQPARLRLFWRREGEAEFSVPSAVLSRKKPTAAELAARPLGAEAGRTLVSDLRCAACHDLGSLNPPESERATERGPNLVGVGDRLKEEWLHRWLRGPKDVRRQATMPALFGDSPEEQADLFAAAKYIASLHGKKREPAAGVGEAEPKRNADVHAVRKAMASTGCIACHLLPGEDPTKFPELRSLDKLGDKTTAAVLRERIAEPRKYYPGSRMPDFELDKEQPKLLDEIADYLAAQHSATKKPAPEAPRGDLLEARWNALFTDEKERGRFEQLPEQERWTALGARVVETRGCLNCHDLDKRTTKAAPPSLAKADTAILERGCLAAEPTATAASYKLTEPQRTAVREALKQFVKPKRTAAPLYTAERQLERSGCLKCHSSGREESWFAKRLLSFVPLGTDQTIHDLAPPNLGGIGEKLTVKAMQGVIDGKTRSRPWMALRMPMFAPEHVKGLGSSLAAIDGVSPHQDETPTKGESAESTGDDDIEIGRQLVGRTGLNCVSCHDIRGVASIGVRGPDLAKVPNRVREEWFRMWLTDPQRFAPGTRMPTVFFGGKSAAPQVLDGDPERQIDALWAYLSQGSMMELPSLAPPANAIVPGGENPHFMPTDRPMIVRGFMPGTGGLRGIALGSPTQTHFAFDSERCTLAAAWDGDFAEIGGWYDNGRGTPEDNALKPLGKIVWRGPAMGGWQAYAGGTAKGDASASPPLAVRYRAAWATTKDAGFSYEVTCDDGATLGIAERPLGTKDGFERRFTITAKGDVPSVTLDIGTAAAGWRVEVDGATLAGSPKAGPKDTEAGAAASQQLVVPAIPDGKTHQVVLRYVRAEMGNKR